MKPKLIDSIMAEFIVAGGLTMRRSEALRWLKTTGITGRTLDYFVFKADALPLAVDWPEQEVTVDGETVHIAAGSRP